MRFLQNTSARPVTGLSFAPNGRVLVAGGSGGYDVWNLKDESHTFIASHATQDLFGCRYDPLGRWLYVSDHVGGFRLLPLKGGAPGTCPGSDERHVTDFDLPADGKRLVVTRGGAGANRVECWNVQPSGVFKSAWSLLDGKPIAADEPFYWNQGRWFTNAVAFSHNGKSIATAESRSGSSGDKSLLVLRDSKSGKLVAEIGKSSTGFQVRLAVALDGSALYAWDNTLVERWDLKSGKRTHDMKASGRAYYRGLALHPSKRSVITVAGDGQARTWNAADLAPLKAEKLNAGKLFSLALSSDGKQAAAGADKGRVVLWDLDG